MREDRAMMALARVAFVRARCGMSTRKYWIGSLTSNWRWGDEFCWIVLMLVGVKREPYES